MTDRQTNPAMLTNKEVAVLLAVAVAIATFIVILMVVVLGL